MAQNNLKQQIDELIDSVAEHPEQARAAKEKMSRLTGAEDDEPKHSFTRPPESSADDDMWDNLPV